VKVMSEIMELRLVCERNIYGILPSTVIDSSHVNTVLDTRHEHVHRRKIKALLIRIVWHCRKNLKHVPCTIWYHS
jgi:hypothetical protein